VAYNQELSSECQKLLNSPVFDLKTLDDEDFKPPIPENSKVIFNIINTKYRQRISGDPSFERSFGEQRARLIQTFSQQQQIFMDQKAAIENIIEKYKESDTDLKSHLEHQFGAALVMYHYQLLVLVEVHCSMQALVDELLSESTLEQREQKEKNQKTKLEAEMKANAAIADKIKDLTSKREKRTKRDKEDDKREKKR